MDMSESSMKLRGFTDNPIKNQRGVSLIEAAIGIVIVGLIALPLLKLQAIDTQYNITRSSDTRFNKITKAVNAYYKSGEKAYPCPADLTLGQGDADFGKGRDCDDFSSIKKCDTGAWKTHGGICRTANSTADSVIIGAVPFADLKLRSEEGIDFWANKILYAVTYSQTQEATFEPSNGGEVRLMVPQGTSAPVELGDKYDFALISMGPNGVGAFTQNGDEHAICGDASTGYEHENCDLDDLFFLRTNPENTSQGIASTVEGVNFYDDFTDAQQSLPEELWYQHYKNALYTPKEFVVSTADKVGIPTSEPDASIDVTGLDGNGSIRLQSAGGTPGNLYTPGICNHSGECFNPEIITGAEPDMTCAKPELFGKAPVNKIANSMTYCGTAVQSANPSNPIITEGRPLQIDTSLFNTNDCPPGELSTGINASGDVECVMVP